MTTTEAERERGLLRAEGRIRQLWKEMAFSSTDFKNLYFHIMKNRPY